MTIITPGQIADLKKATNIYVARLEQRVEVTENKGLVQDTYAELLQRVVAGLEQEPENATDRLNAEKINAIINPMNSETHDNTGVLKYSRTNPIEQLVDVPTIQALQLQFTHENLQAITDRHTALQNIYNHNESFYDAKNKLVELTVNICEDQFSDKIFGNVKRQLQEQFPITANSELDQSINKSIKAAKKAFIDALKDPKESDLLGATLKATMGNAQNPGRPIYQILHAHTPVGGQQQPADISVETAEEMAKIIGRQVFEKMHDTMIKTDAVIISTLKSNVAKAMYKKGIEENYEVMVVPKGAKVKMTAQAAPIAVVSNTQKQQYLNDLLKSLQTGQKLKEAGKLLELNKGNNAFSPDTIAKMNAAIEAESTRLQGKSKNGFGTIMVGFGLALGAGGTAAVRSFNEEGEVNFKQTGLAFGLTLGGAILKQGQELIKDYNLWRGHKVLNLLKPLANDAGKALDLIFNIADGIGVAPEKVRRGRKVLGSFTGAVTEAREKYNELNEVLVHRSA